MKRETIRALLVDDDQGDFAVTRAMMRQILRPKIELDWVATFEEGRDALAKDDYDVYIVDYFLEDRTGLDLLREAGRRQLQSPVIMLTGRGSRAVVTEAMQAGAADYLVKGEIGPAELERSIRYALDRVEVLTALRESEERHRGMFDHLPIGVYRCTPQGGFLDANPGAGTQPRHESELRGAVDGRRHRGGQRGRPAPGPRGDEVTFTVTVTNDGPATATDVNVSDPLPAGLLLVSADPSQGIYTPGSGRWDIGTLDNGASATLTLVATVGPLTGGSTLVNVATAPPLRDQRADPSNNEGSASVTVGRQTADIAVRKEADKVEVRETEQVEFIIFVSNRGPDRASNVIVSEHLPAGLELVSVTPEAGAFNPDRMEWGSRVSIRVLSRA